MDLDIREVSNVLDALIFQDNELKKKKSDTKSNVEKRKFLIDKFKEELKNIENNEIAYNTISMNTIRKLKNVLETNYPKELKEYGEIDIKQLNEWLVYRNVPSTQNVKIFIARKSGISDEKIADTYGVRASYVPVCATNVQNTLVKRAWGRNAFKRHNDVLKTSISRLPLDIRSYNALWLAGIQTFGDLIKLNENELLKVRYIGSDSIGLIKKDLKKFGLSLKEKY